MVVAYAFNPRQRQADLCEFKASLIYRSQFQDRLQSYRETLSGEKPKTNKTDVDFADIEGVGESEMV